MNRLLSIVIALATFTAEAGIMETLIPFSGRLTNNNGVPYAEGQYALTFNLYDTPVGGTSAWTEKHDNVCIANGIMNVYLGSITELKAIDFSRAWYLGITISGSGNSPVYNPEMIPRQRIVPAFFAKNTQAMSDFGWDAVLDGNARTNMNVRHIKLEKVGESEITTVKIKNGTIRNEDLSSSALTAIIPGGTIQPYAGSEDSIPQGWKLVGGGLTTKTGKRLKYIVKVQEEDE